MIGEDFIFRRGNMKLTLTAVENDGAVYVKYRRKGKLIDVSRRLEDAAQYRAERAIDRENARLEHEYKSGGW